MNESLSLNARLYEQVALIRRTEEVIAEIYPSDKIKSPVHLAIGQEYICAAVIEHLKASDYACGTYRGHGVYLAKGGSLNSMMAELYGKSTGCAKGRAGSMHLVESQHGVIGMSAVVGTGIPVAVGYALAIKQKKTTDVVVVFMGDGATEEGCFSESINFAALHKLPILFVCENNQLAIHEPIDKRWATPHITQRVSTYGIPTKQFSKPDIFAIHEYVGEQIKQMRQGAGPCFIECFTHRWSEHVGPNEDYDQGYRSLEAAEPWRKNDVLITLGETLAPALRDSIDTKIETKIQEAVNFAEQSPFPDPKELYDYVYAK
ncbi:thiamine pyrophosphate-dependent dehydrogenase E1 component subunit alpha [Pseudoalteromonas peptidolytica]|uniref:Pyruvate dehydrogenase E1 component alpha subunit n=1 Tax=Pseudoalteromonas peptidolytica F12-50-A1 TaxID=1315280 RepID=A0A8I0MWZ8_9GAMM|nr:thiamine pyrophosphate-dependent dehydrogenase E1 component subunit alpha [Pseudoalteromonas peptidolytica]MBE0346888.1 pyruvate dehydrogenase E1 component alpha subunit [Pseudoalteromonas peptidolytica F12-50-A1]MDW7550056.1 thiamine pyrophosphate-dependent dehydrogenase E1 component subunit alpha [Pseudoalteromonas peptidolytica]NLR13790.1 thiamine pyrophosphate-dependent dehydrogenase E1 component subunit alpha [Pseudoalteromonas peptidolytica]GEK09518.1 pyruvate dehydrogenase E1 componen